MAKSENKTQPTKVNVREFIDSLENETRRADALYLLDLMTEVSGEEPTMWGPSIIGFGQYHYKYESGREGDAPRIGFSPRKANSVLYVIPGYADYGDLLGELGKHKVGKSCLYVTRLENVDRDVLRTIVERGWSDMEKSYPLATQSK